MIDDLFTDVRARRSRGGVRIVTPLLIVAFAANCGAAQTVPVFKEPKHHVVYENKLVRILDVRVPPGDSTLFHVHAERYIGVVITGARGWDQQFGKARTDSRSVSGSLLDNTALALPYTHRVGNVDTVAFHY